MHNNIMAAASRDRPPMLATGRYPQWKSCFLRYIDTRTNGALRKCILEGESLNIQDVKTYLFWEFGKFTSHDRESMKSYYTRFVTIVKQQHDLDTVSYHKLFDVLKQYQKEVNEIRAERIAKNTKPLALVAAAQQYPDPYYQAPSKDIAKPITPPSELASEEDSDPEQAQRDKDMQKNLALIAKYFKKIYKPTNNNLRTSSNS
nr:hypothetical protein [Tanacetum cinerariifolium]